MGGALATYGAEGLNVAMWLVLTPVLLHALGATRFGLLALLGSILADGPLLDLGIAGAAIKYIAEKEATGARPEAEAMIATCLRLYLGLGLAAAALSVPLAIVFPSLFPVAPEDRQAAIQGVLLIGLTLALTIPSAAPGAVLRGLRRYDLAALQSILGTLAVGAGTGFVLLAGGDLAGFIGVYVPAALLTLVGGIWLVRRAAPDLRFGLAGANRRLVPTILGFGSSLFLTRAAAQLEWKTDELVIGGILGLAAIAPYAVALRLSSGVMIATAQLAKVVFPMASALHAVADREQLRGLYLTSTRITVALALVSGCGIAVLARPILMAWVGPQYASGSRIAVVLTAAAMVTASQWPGILVLQGMGHARRLALLALLSGVLNLALSMILAHVAGLMGVALGTLIPTLLLNCCAYLPLALKALDVRLAEFARHAVLPGVLPAAGLVLALGFLEGRVQGVGALALAGGLGAGLYLALYLSQPAARLERQYLHDFGAWSRQRFVGEAQQAP